MDTEEAARDAETIRAVFKSWYRAMQEGDVATLLSLVTPDVIVKGPASPPVVGKSALEQALSTFLDAYSETVDYEVQEIEVSDELAFARLAESATMLPRSGDSPSSVSGMHLTILRRQPDGAWLIARDISSLIDAE